MSSAESLESAAEELTHDSESSSLDSSPLVSPEPGTPSGVEVNGETFTGILANTSAPEIEKAVEALIFASPRAISKVKLKNALTAFQYDVSELDKTLVDLEVKYADRGFQLVKVGGGYQFRTHPQNAELMQRLIEERPQRLSNSSLEVLAIVAYKQPITRAEIDAIRGIDSGHLMRGLLEKDLVRTLGHAETVGRPLLYGTTNYFLEIFSLNSLDDLPALEEFQRELVENTESGGNSLFDSPLAADPDRGDFDAPAEEKVEHADFGLEERAREEETQN